MQAYKMTASIRDCLGCRRQTTEYNGLTKSGFIFSPCSKKPEPARASARRHGLSGPSSFCVSSPPPLVCSLLSLISDDTTVVLQAGRRRKAKGLCQLSLSLFFFGKTVGLLDVLGLRDYLVMSVSSAGSYVTLDQGHCVLRAFQRDWGTEGIQYMH